MLYVTLRSRFLQVDSDSGVGSESDLSDDDEAAHVNSSHEAVRESFFVWSAVFTVLRRHDAVMLKLFCLFDYWLLSVITISHCLLRFSLYAITTCMLFRKNKALIIIIGTARACFLPSDSRSEKKSKGKDCATGRIGRENSKLSKKNDGYGHAYIPSGPIVMLFADAIVFAVVFLPVSCFST